MCTVQPFKRNGIVSGICLIYSMRNCSVDAVKRVAIGWASLIERTYNLELTPYWNGITSCAFSYSNEHSRCPKTATRVQGDYYKDTAMGIVSLLVSCDNSFCFTPMMYLDEDAVRHFGPTVEWLGLTDWVNRHLPRSRTNDFQKATIERR